MRTPTLVGLIAAATITLATPAHAIPKLRPIECAPNCGSYGTILIQNCLTLSAWRGEKGIRQPTAWERKYGCAQFSDDAKVVPYEDDGQPQSGICVSYKCYENERRK